MTTVTRADQQAPGWVHPNGGVTTSAGVLKGSPKTDAVSDSTSSHNSAYLSYQGLSGPALGDGMNGEPGQVHHSGAVGVSFRQEGTDSAGQRHDYGKPRGVGLRQANRREDCRNNSGYARGTRVHPLSEPRAPSRSDAYSPHYQQESYSTRDHPAWHNGARRGPQEGYASYKPDHHGSRWPSHAGHQRPGPYADRRCGPPHDQRGVPRHMDNVSGGRRSYSREEDFRRPGFDPGGVSSFDEVPVKSKDQEELELKLSVTVAQFEQLKEQFSCLCEKVDKAKSEKELKYAAYSEIMARSNLIRPIEAPLSGVQTDILVRTASMEYVAAWRTMQDLEGQMWNMARQVRTGYADMETTRRQLVLLTSRHQTWKHMSGGRMQFKTAQKLVELLRRGQILPTTNLIDSVTQQPGCTVQELSDRLADLERDAQPYMTKLGGQLTHNLGSICYKAQIWHYQAATGETGGPATLGSLQALLVKGKLHHWSVVWTSQGNFTPSEPLLLVELLMGARAIDDAQVETVLDGTTVYGQYVRMEAKVEVRRQLKDKLHELLRSLVCQRLDEYSQLTAEEVARKLEESQREQERVKQEVEQDVDKILGPTASEDTQLQVVAPLRQVRRLGHGSRGQGLGNNRSGEGTSELKAMAPNKGVPVGRPDVGLGQCRGGGIQAKHPDVLPESRIPQYWQGENLDKASSQPQVPPARCPEPLSFPGGFLGPRVIPGLGAIPGLGGPSESEAPVAAVRPDKPPENALVLPRPSQEGPLAGVQHTVSPSGHAKQKIVVKLKGSASGSDPTPTSPPKSTALRSTTPHDDIFILEELGEPCGYGVSGPQTSKDGTLSLNKSEHGNTWPADLVLNLQPRKLREPPGLEQIPKGSESPRVQPQVTLFAEDGMAQMTAILSADMDLKQATAQQGPPAQSSDLATGQPESKEVVQLHNGEGSEAGRSCPLVHSRPARGTELEQTARKQVGKARDGQVEQIKPRVLVHRAKSLDISNRSDSTSNLAGPVSASAGAARTLAADEHRVPRASGASEGAPSKKMRKSPMLMDDDMLMFGNQQRGKAQGRNLENPSAQVLRSEVTLRQLDQGHRLMTKKLISTTEVRNNVGRGSQQIETDKQGRQPVGSSGKCRLLPMTREISRNREVDSRDKRSIEDSSDESTGHRDISLERTRVNRIHASHGSRRGTCSGEEKREELPKLGSTNSKTQGRMKRVVHSPLPGIVQEQVSENPSAMISPGLPGSVLPEVVRMKAEPADSEEAQVVVGVKRKQVVVGVEEVLAKRVASGEVVAKEVREIIPVTAVAAQMFPSNEKDHGAQCSTERSGDLESGDRKARSCGLVKAQVLGTGLQDVSVGNENSQRIPTGKALEDLVLNLMKDEAALKLIVKHLPEHLRGDVDPALALDLSRALASGKKQDRHDNSLTTIHKAQIHNLDGSGALARPPVNLRSSRSKPAPAGTRRGDRQEVGRGGGGASTSTCATSPPRTISDEAARSQAKESQVPTVLPWLAGKGSGRWPSQAGSRGTDRSPAVQYRGGTQVVTAQELDHIVTLLLKLRKDETEPVDLAHVRLQALSCVLSVKMYLKHSSLLPRESVVLPAPSIALLSGRSVPGKRSRPGRHLRGCTPEDATGSRAPKRVRWASREPSLGPPPEKDDDECVRMLSYHRAKALHAFYLGARRQSIPERDEDEDEEDATKPVSKAAPATHNPRSARAKFRNLIREGLLEKGTAQTTRRKKLRFGRSNVHGWGLFSQEVIKANDFVIEYVGEIIPTALSDKREKEYEASGLDSSYLFRLDDDWVVDATRKGGLARFINHCCQPNCHTKIITDNGAKKIAIYALRDIQPGEELSYDYKFSYEDNKIPCHCGAPNCRKWMN